MFVNAASNRSSKYITRLYTDLCYLITVGIVGFVSGLLFDFPQISNLALGHILKNTKSVFLNNSNPIFVFKRILLQLDAEFVSVLTSLVAFYSTIPKIFLSFVISIDGFMTAVSIKLACQSLKCVSLSIITIFSVFEIVLLFIKFSFASVVLRDRCSYSDKNTTNEFSIIFSSKSRIILHKALTASGSMILLKLIENFFIYLILP